MRRLGSVSQCGILYLHKVSHFASAAHIAVRTQVCERTYSSIAAYPAFKYHRALYRGIVSYDRILYPRILPYHAVLSYSHITFDHSAGIYRRSSADPDAFIDIRHLQICKDDALLHVSEIPADTLFLNSFIFFDIHNT